MGGNGDIVVDGVVGISVSLSSSSSTSSTLKQAHDDVLVSVFGQGLTKSNALVVQGNKDLTQRPYHQQNEQKHHQLKQQQGQQGNVYKIRAADIAVADNASAASATAAALVLVVCSLCQQRIRGAVFFCPDCGHGGHPEHMSLWFHTHLVRLLHLLTFFFFSSSSLLLFSSPLLFLLGSSVDCSYYLFVCLFVC